MKPTLTTLARTDLSTSLDDQGEHLAEIFLQANCVHEETRSYNIFKQTYLKYCSTIERLKCV